MTREILFKAKRKDNGEWVEGYVVVYPSGKTEIHKKCIEPPDVLIKCEVDPETICQYTGLTDKNGRKIWENDVISRTDLHVISEPSVGFIKYDLKNSSFLIHWTDKVKYSPTYHWKDRLKVIGNIFDNPELLEVGK